MMRFLKYLFILAEIFSAADSLSVAGASTSHIIRGIKYRGAEYELKFSIKRLT